MSLWPDTSQTILDHIQWFRIEKAWAGQKSKWFMLSFTFQLWYCNNKITIDHVWQELIEQIHRSSGALQVICFSFNWMKGWFSCGDLNGMTNLWKYAPIPIFGPKASLKWQMKFYALDTFLLCQTHFLYRLNGSQKQSEYLCSCVAQTPLKTLFKILKILLDWFL